MSPSFFSFTDALCLKHICGAPCVYPCSKFNLVVTISMLSTYNNGEAKYNSSALGTASLDLNPVARNSSYRTKCLSFTQPKTSSSTQ